MRPQRIEPMPSFAASLIRIFQQSVALCDPEALTRAALQRDENHLRVSQPRLCRGADGRIVLSAGSVVYETPVPRGRLMVVCVGKAAVGQARALAAVLGDGVARGVVVAPHTHAGLPVPDPFELRHAGHPLPDADSVAAADALLQLSAELLGHDLLMCAISGGTSALLTAPDSGLSLANCIDTTRLLLGSGADIHAINTVRKHLSRIKGGRLAAACKAPLISLLVSDVASDVLHAIGSGPTLADPTTFRDALAVLDAYGLRARVPATVRGHLEAGAAGDITETPKPDDLRLQQSAAVLLAGPQHLLNAATAYSEQGGFDTVPHPLPPAGASLDVGALTAQIAALARASPQPRRPTLHLWVREPTVHIDGPAGEGGRNSHLALLAARQIAGMPATFLSAGSDGIDGTSTAAGAVVDGTSWRRAEQLGLDPAGSLRRFDSAVLHRALGSAVVTGPTGTNFLDLEMLALHGSA